MFNEKCCLMCIFYATKKNCIGIRKNFCVRHQMRAVPGNICEYYIRDYKKVMHYNNFRYTRDNESKHTCEYCANRAGKPGKTKERIHWCKAMNVDFPDDFNPVWHTCDRFVDGGDDAFIDCLCDEYYEALEEMRGGKK